MFYWLIFFVVVTNNIVYFRDFGEEPFDIKGLLAELNFQISSERKLILPTQKSELFINTLKADLNVLEKNQAHLDWEVLRKYGTTSLEDIKRNAEKILTDPKAIDLYYVYKILSEMNLNDNALVVFLDNYPVVPDFVYYEQGEPHFKYHSIGRGFLIFGSTTWLSEDHYALYMPLRHIRGQDIDDLRKFFIWSVKHELIGHDLLNLRDHYERERAECLMTPRYDVCDLIEYVKEFPDKPNAFYICNQCCREVSRKQMEELEKLGFVLYKVS
jgi:hypothetical protein